MGVEVWLTTPASATGYTNQAPSPPMGYTETGGSSASGERFALGRPLAAIFAQARP
eukprot:CAMPEP_0176325824 /NCGR_PEP_ID=MMETSP0121_2-20121125/73611_1 /TAXON_ID=160619 /ORGANISM="Kryptoperidinium foliaceum, Strain CCMP 1326" /LENGTH=55 /DNA_ID=CAMNT_0017668405 /DNA_START=103 /DNA_END=268 /DNA_ORIENTATION=-